MSECIVSMQFWYVRKYCMYASMVYIQVCNYARMEVLNYTSMNLCRYKYVVCLKESNYVKMQYVMCAISIYMQV